MARFVCLDVNAVTSVRGSWCIWIRLPPSTRTIQTHPQATCITADMYMTASYTWNVQTPLQRTVGVHVGVWGAPGWRVYQLTTRSWSAESTNKCALFLAALEVSAMQRAHTRHSDAAFRPVNVFHFSKTVALGSTPQLFQRLHNELRETT